MPFSLIAREAGRVQICGHRGYSLHYPENTLPAFQAAKSWGATMVEIDVVLTADGEPIILHDLTVDRTTDGHGFAGDLSLEQIRTLDAGSWFHQRFARTRIPTLVEVLDWANGEGMRLLVEIKEAERADLGERPYPAAPSSDRQPHDRPGEHVLDIGCGSGTTVLELDARVGPGGHVLGADISNQSVTRARQRPQSHPPFCTEVLVAVQFVPDSLLEEAGFEPPVPPGKSVVFSRRREGRRPTG